MLYELTVRENIAYSARSRLPRSWTTKEVENFIDATIESLDLMHVADNLISSVSGGQRKRVNIAMELATCPSAIFLDEPTSGLDSTAALKVAQTMKKIAVNIGINVVSVIHQPRYEIFDEFDDLLLMIPGGATAYLGPREHVQPYFEKLGFYFAQQNNPADCLMDILSGKGDLVDISHCSGAREIGQQIQQMVANGSAVFEEYQVSDLAQRWNDYKSKTYFILSRESSRWEIATPETLDLESKHLCREFDENSEEGTLGDPNTRCPGTPVHEELPPPLPPPDVVKPTLTSVHEGYVSRDHERLRQACFRRGTGLFRQIVLVHNRSLLQQYRKINALLLELFIATVSGLLMGIAVSSYDGALYRGLFIYPFTLISPAPVELVVPMLALIIGCAVGLSGSPAGVKIFCEERDIYFRESSAGLSPLGYFIGKNIASTYRFVISSLHFTAFFMFFATPGINFYAMYMIILLMFYTVYGVSFALAMVVRRENASMIAVCATIIFAVLNGSGPSISDLSRYSLDWILVISYARWGTEAWYSSELVIYDGVYEIQNISAKLFGYTLQRYNFDLLCIFILGCAFRLIAFILMVCLNRQKQR